MANLIPCERARPTDQANSKTCVMHAIGNAIVEALMDFGLDMKLDEVLGGMKQLLLEGNRVEEFHHSYLRMLTDKNSGDHFDIRIYICERAQEEVQKRLQDKTIEAVAVYREDSLHCVYIDGLAWTGLAPTLGELNYVLINSWGAHNSKFLLGPREVDVTYEVAVTYTRSRSPLAIETNNVLSSFSSWPRKRKRPTTPDHLYFNSASNSPVRTPSFDSYSSSPTFWDSDSWMNKNLIQ